MMKQYFVSCIMPTANRAKYIPQAISNFLRQDYGNTELIIIDDGIDSIANLIPASVKIKYQHFPFVSSVGTKRNYACSLAAGEIIMHWDDDDWYAPDWLSKQVECLINTGADVCGIEHVHFFSPIENTFWLGTNKNRNIGFQQQWISGATFAYWKKYWLHNPFRDRNIAEDDAFLKNGAAHVYAHDYIDGFVALLHKKNTTHKYFE